MEQIFTYTSYKDFVRERLAARPKGGRGEYRRLAQHLKVHTTFVSQVFGGAKELSLEQAAAACDFLGLSDREADFFVTLVEAARAGSTRLAAVFSARLEQARRDARDLARLLPQDRRLTETERAVFYSSWFYSGARLTASLPGVASVSDVAQRLALPAHKVANIVAFLLDHGLLTATEKGYALGPQRTHVEAESPFAATHHRNWRLKAMTRFDKLGRDELAFTAPLTIARDDVAAVRAELTAMIERVSAVVAGTEPEALACLNIDWVVW